MKQRKPHARIKLAEASVAKARKDYKARGRKSSDGKDEDHILDTDIPGFHLRLRGDSAVYHFRGETFRIKLGDADAMTADKARKEAKQLYADAVKGKDLSADARKPKAQPAGCDSFKVVADAYLLWQRTRTRDNRLDINGKPVKGLKLRSIEEIERHLFKHCELFHKLPVQSIARRQIAERLNEIEQGSGPVAANRVRSTLSGLFKYAIMEGYGGDDLANPVQYTQERAEHGRDRCLTPFGLNNEQKAKLKGAPEIKIVWDALPDGDYGDILKLLLLTGCRLKEIGLLRWSWVNADMTFLTIPPGVEPGTAKNWHSHRVPLVGRAREILLARKEKRIAGRDYVFGTKEGGKGFSNWSRSKENLLEANPRAASIPHWTPHAFRHTCETALKEMGVRSEIRDAFLNHSDKSAAKAAKTYDHAELDDAKIETAHKWAGAILEIIGKAA